MDKMDDVCIDIEVMIEDIRCKSELKRQREIEAKQLELEIITLKCKVTETIKRKLYVREIEKL